MGWETTKRRNFLIKKSGNEKTAQGKCLDTPNETLKQGEIQQRFGKPGKRRFRPAKTARGWLDIGISTE